MNASRSQPVSRCHDIFIMEYKLNNICHHPSSLFVVVSWTSFLIPSEDIQGRMALLVTLFLVLVSKFEWAKLK